MPKIQDLMSDTKLTLGWQSWLLRGWARTLRLFPKGRYTLFHAGWKILGSPDRFIGELHGIPFVVDTLDRYTSVQMYLWGCYEPAVTLVFLSLLAPSICVMDIGANKGYFSLLAAQRVGSQGRVFSYEPSPRNIEDLVGTQKLSKYQHWQIIPLAISSNIGSVKFQDYGLEQGHSGWGTVSTSGSLTVRATTVDSELERLSLKQVDLLKMDIEGHEIEAIKGMVNSLSHHRIRHVLIELHLSTFSPDDLAKFITQFSDLGYRGSYIREDNVSIHQCLRTLYQQDKVDASKVLQPLDPSKIVDDRIHVLWSVS